MLIEYNRFALSEGGRYALTAKNQGALVATENQNCRCVNGVLKNAAGIVYMKNYYGSFFYVPNNARRVLTVNGELGQDGPELGCAYTSFEGLVYVYSQSAGGFKKMSTRYMGYTQLLKNVYDKDGDSFFAIGQNMIALIKCGEVVYETWRSCNTSSGCLFHDRFFYGCENAVCFSDVGDATDLQESLRGAGKIDLPGDAPIQRIIALNEVLFLFKSDGIWEMYAKGSADDFSIKRVDYYADRIACGSVSRCGDSIFFVNEAGELYRLRGGGVQKLLENLPEEFCGDGLQVTGGGGLYFLSRTQGRTLVTDGNGDYYFSTCPIKVLSPCGGEALCVYSGVVCKMSERAMLPDGENVRFIAKNWLEKDGRELVVEKVRLFGVGDVAVRVGNFNVNAFANIQLLESGVDVPVHVRGKTFEIDIQLLGNCKIWKMSALVSDVGGGK